MKKKITVYIVILSFTILLTACQTKGLKTYQDAMKNTEAISKAEVIIESEIRTTFNKTGLTIEEEIELSAFESMKTKISTKYDDAEPERVESNIYYIAGAVGIDAAFYVNNGEVIIQIPLINMYMKLDDIMDDIDEEKSSLSKEPIEIQFDFNEVMKSWLSVFNEENVVVGNNTYIITDEGQVKTTAYSFKLDKEQLKTLKETLLEKIDLKILDQLAMDYFKEFQFSQEKEEFKINIEKLLDGFTLTYLEGEAFVDYDNRLIRQSFILYAKGNNPIPGNLKEFQIELTMTYTNLGENQEFDFPKLTEDNVLDKEELNSILDTFK